MADDGAGIEVERSEAAVDRRVVVLDAGGDAEEARLEIADEGDEVVALAPARRRARTARGRA